MRTWVLVGLTAWTLLAGGCRVAPSMGTSGAGFPLVDGTREAVIVGDDTVPRVPQLPYVGPSNPLQHYIERSTGRKLRVIPEKEYDPAKGLYPIFVGNTQTARDLFGERLKTMDDDSYVVHVTRDRVVLAGAAKHSSAYAQFDFLREYLGIDTYLPCKIGTVIPHHEKVLIPVGTRVETPAFRSRDFSSLNTNNGTRSAPDIPWRMYRRFAFHHNVHTFITVPEFGASHPEYFPEQGGKRIVVSSAASPGPCISNPDVARIVIEKSRKLFDEHPEQSTISLGMTDGGWCECAGCRAMDGPSLEVNGRTTPKSRRYYLFLNQVARAIRESHPGKSVGVLGYAGADLPPADLTVERNIIPYLCYTRGNWYDPDVKAADLRGTDAWLDRVDQIGIYEYLYGSGFSIPCIYNHFMADFLQHVARRGGGGFYAEIYSNHGLDGPKAWVTEKLLWDPFQDVDRLVRRWCDALFEDAARPMERYFNRLEKTRIANGKRRTEKPFGKFYFYNNDRQLDLFLPQDMPALWADLDAARKKARNDLVRQRIEYFASTLRITDLTVRQYHAYKETNRLFKEKVPSSVLLAALIDGDRKAPQEDVKAYIEKIQAEDLTKFLGGVEVSLSAELARSIVVDLAWNEVYRLLKSGERDVGRLAAAGQAQITAAGPPGAANDPIAQKRIQSLLAAASRIAPAYRASAPPEIDGRPTENVWKWVDQDPWFAWKSGSASTFKTQFALAYDDTHLYVALRCPQADLAKMTRCEGYGASAWKYASVEIHLNPDARDAGPKEIPYFQTIPAYGGGMWEKEQRATEKYAVTDNGKDLFEVELSVSLQKLRMTPKDFPYLRINFIRNIAAGGHSGLGWFPSTGAHASYDARGWVVFVP